MLRREEWMELQVLAKAGWSVRAIARQTGHSRHTVRKLLALGAQDIGARRYAPRGSQLDPYKAYIADRYQQTGLSAVRLYGEVQAQGYTGGVDVVRRYVRTLVPQRQALRRATVRYETAPGEQGQADWAYCGRLLAVAGDATPVYAFLLELSFSRLLYVELTTTMRLETLIGCHERAFAALGGCPRTMLYDNMKQVRLTPETLNPLFVDFADHWGFAVRTHRVRRPRTKGKVERMVDYLKEGCLRGRTFADLANAQAQVTHWLDTVANVRVHATTARRPVDLWVVEQPHLQPVTGVAPYRLATRAVRTVSSECWVHFQGARYSLPPTYVGQRVLVELHSAQQRVVIRADQVIVAEHAQATTRGATVSDPAHIAALWHLTLAQSASAPLPAWQHSDNGAVETRPLALYEALVS
jgi:transposase